MQISRKTKIFSVIGFVVIAIIVIACASIPNHSRTSIPGGAPTTIPQWKAKYPQLFSNASLSKLIESNSIDTAKLPESIVKLQGSITNPFGVRDDILEYIITAIPNNPRLLDAFIKYAAYTNITYYAPTDKEKLAIIHEFALATGCTVMFSSKKWEDVDISRHIDKMMRDTPERDQYMWDIDRRVFGWKIIGSGLNVNDERAACERGDF